MDYTSIQVPYTLSHFSDRDLPSTGPACGADYTILPYYAYTYTYTSTICHLHLPSPSVGLQGPGAFHLARVIVVPTTQTRHYSSNPTTFHLGNTPGLSKSPGAPRFPSFKVCYVCMARGWNSDSLQLQYRSSTDSSSYLGFRRPLIRSSFVTPSLCPLITNASLSSLSLTHTFTTYSLDAYTHTPTPLSIRRYTPSPHRTVIQ